MTQDTKKKHRLTDITFEHDGAAISLVGGIVGGPANQQTTLLWKSKGTDHIVESDVIEALKKSAETVSLEKAEFVSEIRETLRNKIKDKFADNYEWLYLEDFSEDQIVFSTDYGLYIVGYSLSDDEYVIEDVATEVEYKTILVEKEGLRLSKDAQSKLKEGEFSLLNKALNDSETAERLTKAIGEINQKVKKKMEDIEKAVAAIREEKEKEIQALTVELEKAKETVAEYIAKQKEQLMKSRVELVAQFDKEGAEALVKATESLDEEGFQLIVKALETKQKAMDETQLFNQVSETGAGEAESSATADLIKAKYAKQ